MAHWEHSSLWKHHGVLSPEAATLAINLAPFESLDPESLREDFTDEGIRVVLLSDSSMFATALLSEDSLASLGAVYDVRRATDAELERLLAPWRDDPSSNAKIPTIEGTVYVVHYEWSRTWPGHGETVVEVRPTRGGYAAYHVLMWGIE